MDGPRITQTDFSLEATRWPDCEFGDYLMDYWVLFMRLVSVVSLVQALCQFVQHDWWRASMNLFIGVGLMTGSFLHAWASGKVEEACVSQEEKP